MNLVELGACTFDNIEDALNEIRLHLEEMDDKMEVEVTIKEMTEEEFLNLPEFQGY